MEIGNKSPEAKFTMSCISCGATDKIHLMAHRNKEGNINGFIACCNNCDNKIAGKQFGIWSEDGKAII
jgi:hypothetical protein